MNLLNFRFIQPVRRRSKRRYEQYDESPVFDSLAPVTGNICSHKEGCDAFILQVSSFFVEKLNNKNKNKNQLLGIENVCQNRCSNRIDTKHFETCYAFETPLFQRHLDDNQ